MSRQRLSPSLGESSHHVCPRCSGTGTVRDNESLSLSILRLIEEEALKENTQEVHAIVPVPIASYLLNEKRTAVNAIETRQNGVRCVIVPNDQMETPHYSVLRVRKGEETPTLSYLLPKLHEEAMALPTEEEYVERKQPEQPALATFAMPDVPPAPALQEPAAKAAAPKAAAATAAVAAQPGLISRFFGALKSIFGGSEEVKPVEQPAPKAEEKPNASRIVVNRVRTIVATVTIAVITVIIAVTVTTVTNVRKTAKTVKITAVTVVSHSSKMRKLAITASKPLMLQTKRNPVMSSRRRVANATAVVTMTSVRLSRKLKS